MDKRISNLREIASITRYTVSEGRAKGLDVIDCDNGRIRFTLCVSRALDIMQLWYRGENASFISKNGFVAEVLPFHNRFEGGMLYTCGLESVGNREGLELHGTHHLTAAEVTRAECTEDGITIEANVSSTALFGQDLVFRRRISTSLGSDSVNIEDSITNEGYLPSEYCLLYHINVGYPLLDDGAAIEGKVTSCEARSDFAKERIDRAFVIEEPTLPTETCYYLGLESPEISLVNRSRGRRFTVSYSGDTLPEFLMWKSMVAGDFALGLEPTTTKLDGSFKRTELAAGARTDFRVTLTVSEI